jgi:hypothetical protein
MKLKILALTVFLAGLGASFAVANDGKGKSEHAKGSKCTEIHLNGTIAPQTLTVTVDRASKKLNVTPGTQVVLQVGGTGQTARITAEACQVTVGTATQLQVKEAHLKVRSTKTTTTAPATTTAPTTTTTP